MIRRLTLTLSLALAATALHAQERVPPTLFEATQCLVTGKYEWVDVSNLKELQLAYHEDSKTFDGSKYVYVIVYTGPKRDQGKVFDIRLKDHHTYSVENNARFSLANGEIKFTEPPLGGNWAENQLTASIQKILHHKKWYGAEVKLLLKPSSHLRCETAVEDVVHPEPKPQTQSMQ